MTWRLDPRCELGVAVEGTDGVDEEVGDGLQGPASRAVRQALEPLRRKIRKLGESASIRRYAELVAWAERQPAYDALCTSRVAAGRRVLRKDIVWASHGALRPTVLRFRHAGAEGFRALDVPCGERDWRIAQDLVSALASGVSERALQKLKRPRFASELVDDLLAGGVLRDDVPEPAPAAARGEGIWFLGHNSVLVSSGRTRVLVDPWFRPWRDADPEDYRPLRPADVGDVDAIVVTHGHGDHFHLGSLLLMKRDTPVLVPYVERESLLATDLVQRLREIGMVNARAVRWWETRKVGDVTIEALPFYGEQPSSIDVIDRALRNVGNTWVVRTPGFSSAFLADTGRDALGSMADVALEVRRRTGPVDIVFGGMRGFETRPLFLPFTTLDAMFPNVPLELLPVRQKLMHDAKDLLACAEIFGARHVVPYADGGAPWYWREGMGPTYATYAGYPGEREAEGRDVEDPHSAPFPERLVEEAQRRYPGDPLVTPLVLRPGDLVRFRAGGVRVGRVEGFAWPWD